MGAGTHVCEVRAWARARASLGVRACGVRACGVRACGVHGNQALAARLGAGTRVREARVRS